MDFSHFRLDGIETWLEIIDKVIFTWCGTFKTRIKLNLTEQGILGESFTQWMSVLCPKQRQNDLNQPLEMPKSPLKLNSNCPLSGRENLVVWFSKSIWRKIEDINTLCLSPPSGLIALFQRSNGHFKGYKIGCECRAFAVLHTTDPYWDHNRWQAAQWQHKINWAKFIQSNK